MKVFSVKFPFKSSPNPQSLADIFNTPVFQNSKNLDENLKKMGRVACIKMDNVLDALCLLTKEVKVTLPLNNGTVDDPILYPSKFLIQYLNDYTPQTSVINIQTAGNHFSLFDRKLICYKRCEFLKDE